MLVWPPGVATRSIATEAATLDFRASSCAIDGACERPAPINYQRSSCGDEMEPPTTRRSIGARSEFASRANDDFYGPQTPRETDLEPRRLRSFQLQARRDVSDQSEATSSTGRTLESSDLSYDTAPRPSPCNHLITFAYVVPLLRNSELGRELAASSSQRLLLSLRSSSEQTGASKQEASGPRAGGQRDSAALLRAPKLSKWPPSSSGSQSPLKGNKC